MPDNTQWFYAKAGQQFGPVAREQLGQLVASGQLSAGDLVWSEGMTDWKPAGQIPGLKPANPVPMSQPAAVAAQTYAPAQAYAVQPHPAQYGAQQITYPSGASYNGLAITGFILALIPGLTIVGLILCLVALSGMKSGGNREGYGLAKAGMIISIIYLCMGFIFACLWFTIIATAIGLGSH
ncbi:MAG TPA: GYF domain-containing protein [Humisphaera sp.]|jgi:hypothetical protein|nr:GYF domain-containing protein [Humisphaera sp.]